MKTQFINPKRFLVIFSILTVILSLVIPFLPLSGEERVYNDTLRFHVIANSDSKQDQLLKLKVRDAVLSGISDLLDKCSSKSEAVATVNSNKNYIESIAKNTVAENGYKYNIAFSLCEEYYPEREYEGVRLPSGTYTSLRLIIGKGEGHNWWCILYPTLCTGASKPEKELASAGFTPNQIRVLTENESTKYKVRFKIIEFFGKLFS